VEIVPRLNVIRDIPSRKISPFLRKRGLRITVCVQSRADVEEGEIAIAGVRSGIILILLIAVVGKAELQNVLALEPGEIVEPIVVTVVIKVRTETKNSPIPC